MDDQELPEKTGMTPDMRLTAEVNAVWRSHDPLLWVITAQHNGRRGGLIATFVMQASIVDRAPRALIGIGRSHFTWELIRESRAFAAHLIDPDCLDWCPRFGLKSGRDTDKLDGLATRAGVLGTPILLDTAGHLECRVEADFDTGDRSLFLGQVVSAFRHSSRAALTAGQMIAALDPAQSRDMHMQYLHDSVTDFHAIRHWRDERQPAPNG